MKKHQNRGFYTSRDIAKTRAGLTIYADRLDCNPDLFYQMRCELTDIISKYINTDEDSLEIQMTFIYGMKRGITDVKTIQIK